MKTSILTFILLFQILSIACTPKKTETLIQRINKNVNLNTLPTNDLKIPDNWEKVEGCGLSFFAPTDLKEIKVQPIDSCVKEYRNQNTIISVDLVDGADESGSRRNEYAGEKDFKVVNELINGQKAEIILYYSEVESGFADRKGLFYGAVLHIPNVNEKKTLTVWTNSRRAEDRENCVKVFSTIKFNK